MQNWINYPIIVVLTAGLFLSILSDSRKIITAAAAGVFLMVFVINIQFLSFTFALAQFLTGIMALFILNLSPSLPAQSMFSGRWTAQVFRGVAFGFGLAVILFIVPRSNLFVSIPMEQILVALFLMMCGFIQFGISQNAYRVFNGLIVFFIGFEVLYGSVERSLLINGFLVALDLLIALVGSYLITNSYEGSAE